MPLTLSFPCVAAHPKLSVLLRRPLAAHSWHSPSRLPPPSPPGTESNRRAPFAWQSRCSPQSEPSRFRDPDTLRLPTPTDWHRSGPARSKSSRTEHREMRDTAQCRAKRCFGQLCQPCSVLPRGLNLGEEANTQRAGAESTDFPCHAQGIASAAASSSVRRRFGPRILRSAQPLRSATVKCSRNGLAFINRSRLVRPVESAFAITSAASELSGAESMATAPAAPAKWAK